MELDEVGALDDRDDPAPEARIQASIDELLQAQTRGDPVRLAVLRAQMARDLSSPVPKKRPKQGKCQCDNQWALLDHARRVDGACGGRDTWRWDRNIAWSLADVTKKRESSAVRLHTGEAQRAEGESGLISGYVGRHVRCSAQALGAGVGPASTRLAEQ